MPDRDDGSAACAPVASGPTLFHPGSSPVHLQLGHGQNQKETYDAFSTSALPRHHHGAADHRRRSRLGPALVRFLSPKAYNLGWGGFDASKYMGTWYELARIDHRFEKA